MSATIRKFEELFKEWRKLEIYKGVNFYEDGIVNHELYTQVEKGKRILIIGKEPNGEGDMEIKPHSFTEEWNVGEPRYRFANRIGEWAHGILNDFPGHDTIGVQRYEALKRIAFMNVKKSAGGNAVPEWTIFKTVEVSRDLILNEIELIDPDIIICCLGFSGNIINQIFGEVVYKSQDRIRTFDWNNKLVIEFYHPSARKSASYLYNLLKETIQ